MTEQSGSPEDPMLSFALRISNVKPSRMYNLRTTEEPPTINVASHCHRYLGGGHSRLWDQVLVDAGAREGSFAAIDGQGAGSGKPCRECCISVLLGNLLDDQHFGHHLFANRRVFWNRHRTIHV